MRAGHHLTTLIAVAALATSAAAGEWRHEKGEEGNRVSSRATEGTSVREYRVEMQLDVAPDAMWAVLTDWGGVLAEHPQVIEQRVLWRGDDEVVVYEVDDCSPIKPRDFAYRIRIGRDGDARTLRNELAEDLAPEPRDGIVRVPVYRTSWTVRPSGEGTEAVYTVLYDAGGRVPSKVYGLGMPSYLYAMRAWFQEQASAR